MPLPDIVARLNRRLVNRFMEPLADHPPFARLTHVGRGSGQRYQIPINVFPRGDGFVFALTYGHDTDWLKNVMAAGGAELAYAGHDYRLRDPRIVGREAVWSDLPLPVKPMLRLLAVTEFLIVDAQRSAPGP
jgi:deazaflavin-dependent oxidoreductase (nitroreductase family)